MVMPASSVLQSARSIIAWPQWSFYRVHLTVFTLVPLVAAGIFYAANGEVEIPFIDCLFVCVSAMTMTGLVTFNISTATVFQQAILFFLMCIGNIVAVSVTMIWIRRHFFRARFDHIVKTSASARQRADDVERKEEKKRSMARNRMQNAFKSLVGMKAEPHVSTSDEKEAEGKVPHSDTSGSSASSSPAENLKAQSRATKKRKGPLTADMVRRMDGPAVLVNQSGAPSRLVQEKTQSENHQPALSPAEEDPVQHPGILNVPTGHGENSGLMRADTSPAHVRITLPSEREHGHSRENSGALHVSGENASLGPKSESNSVNSAALPRVRRGSDSLADPQNIRADGSLVPQSKDTFKRAHTVEFAEPRHLRSTEGDHAMTTGMLAPRSSQPYLRNSTAFERTQTLKSMGSQQSMSRGKDQFNGAQHSGFGGWPTPIDLAQRAFERVVTTQTTMPRTTTIASTHSATGASASEGGRSAPYLSFDITVARNSQIDQRPLTEAQRNELGGVEYRAIDMLAKLIPVYWLFLNFFCIVLVAPWLSSKAAAKYHTVFEAQGESAPNYTWYWVFNVVSAFSNTGMSLIDSSMIQLADGYLMLIPMGFLILAGNTAFPIILRFFIWVFSKMVPTRSVTFETLRFLLDHPRRCYVYLFPANQTWWLLVVLIILNITDWVAFLVLDIGNPEIEAIPVGQRVFDALFQAIAVRTAGFQVVGFLGLAPAVLVLYVTMMYVSAYPLALSVRSTNVYEERSLGIYDEEPEGEDELPRERDALMWGRFLASHARRQLAFDMWWLGFALWLMCVIERNEIQNPVSNGWFDIFHILFELVSAYGTVGLSTGTPFDNFSLSGRFRTLSKLVVCMVMLRGRHRGLPMAIDRAVLLPMDLGHRDFERDRTLTEPVPLTEEPATMDEPANANPSTSDDPTGPSKNSSIPRPASSHHLGAITEADSTDPTRAATSQGHAVEPAQ
ncbi:unnamed protein product [Tilletia controversa]|nr:hypothetical protein CF336_g2918 [Tilletia laevis]KAE8197976.1 hypothetical protein CF328_g3684 [Tilletia controversa]CAD6893120.1 unnamed protein product [Tilletia caries]KAE8203025.1 hypothetical protein CF335_g3194 [Tilletia laevis]CAD6898053.1 unnamed protein product [Tilletia caries]